MEEEGGGQRSFNRLIHTKAGRWRREREGERENVQFKRQEADGFH